MNLPGFRYKNIYCVACVFNYVINCKNSQDVQNGIAQKHIEATAAFKQPYLPRQISSKM